MKKNILFYSIMAILIIAVSIVVPTYTSYKQAHIAKVLADLDKKLENFRGVGLEFDWMREEEGRPVMKWVMDFSRGPLLWYLHIADRKNITSAQIITDEEGVKVYHLIEKRPHKKGEIFSRVEIDVSVDKGILKQVKKYDWKNKLVFLEKSRNLRLKQNLPKK